MYNYEDAISILTSRFSEMKSVYESDQDEYKGLPYLLYESVFVQFIIENANAQNSALLGDVFKFVEEMLRDGDEDIINLIEVAVIESLYFDDDVHDKKTLMSYFGELTLKSYESCSE